MLKKLLLFFILLNTSSCAYGEKTMETPFKIDEQFLSEFSKIAKGMSEADVKAKLGEPANIVANDWFYFEKRAPKAGEQLMLYKISFKDSIVDSTAKVAGPDATGSIGR